MKSRNTVATIVILISANVIFTALSLPFPSIICSALIFAVLLIFYRKGRQKEDEPLSEIEVPVINTKVSDSEAELFKDSANALREGFIILDGSGKVILSNHAARNLLSLGDGERNLLTDSHSPAIRELINQAKSGYHADADIILDGAEYELSADPVFDNGAVKSIAILILRESEKEKSALIRREFTANVSHELKTPLHAISGYAELMKNGMVREEDKERFLSNIYSEAQRLVDLIDDTIKLSRLDEGATQFVKERVDLYAIAEKTLSLLDTKASRTGVKLILSGKETYIDGIPQLLDGIIFNLVDNAIKYNRENGSVSVEIKENEKNVTLNVCDTGIGIPEEYRERVFERFYRVDKSHSKEVGGTGLGLSIVKHAAKLHQAHIELYSVVNGGTSVRVIFPKN
ncbi:MAG: ATP-binding protein [Clostridia bacterium]|nr:ATP-binding protein [Clostridia bacterium]